MKSGLLDSDLMEAESIKKGADSGLSVAVGSHQNAVVESGLRHLLLGGLADLGLEVHIRINEQAGAAGKDLGLAVVNAGGEDLGCGQFDMNGIAVDGDVGGLELLEIDAGDDFAVSYEDELVADQKVGDVRALTLAFNDFVEGVDDGFEAGELADPFDDGGGGRVDCGGAASDEVGELAPEAGVGKVTKGGDGQEAQQDSGKKRGKEYAEDSTHGHDLVGAARVFCWMRFGAFLAYLGA